MSTDPLFHISQQLGAIQLPGTKRVQFRIYFPRGVDPHISSVEVIGRFRDELNGTFDYALAKTFATFGTLWTLGLDKELEEGFYEYQYRVEFDDGSSRLVADPCARYSGSTAKSSAFVIGTRVAVTPLQNRLATRDLVIYELHAYDFTKNTRGHKCPVRCYC